MVRDEEFSIRLNNTATYLGFTALHYAVLVNSINVVNLLLKYGANPCIENDAGHKPIQYAKENSEIEKILKEMTAKVTLVY